MNLRAVVVVLAALLAHLLCGQAIAQTGEASASKVELSNHQAAVLDRLRARVASSPEAVVKVDAIPIGVANAAAPTSSLAAPRSDR